VTITAAGDADAGPLAAEIIAGQRLNLVHLRGLAGIGHAVGTDPVG